MDSERALAVAEESFLVNLLSDETQEIIRHDMREYEICLLYTSYCVELDKDILTLKSDPVLAVPGKVLSEGTDFEGHRFLRQAACGILMGGII